MKKLRTTGDWDEQLLSEYYTEIEKIGVGEFGLDIYPNQIEIINSTQMLDAYSTHAMPVMYNHWSFGKDFVRNKDMYDKGHMNLAFEIVSNTDPCIAYIMEENSIMMQALVLSHACIGHNNFFKTNYLFKDWTDANSIVDYLIFAKKYISVCEEKYGADDVEIFLDACHSLSLYGVDKYKRPKKMSDIEEEKKRLASFLSNERNFDDVISRTLPTNKKEIVKDNEFFKNTFQDMEAEENVLYFMEKKAPYLQDWQREILRITRKIAQYFRPQMKTKGMNEGHACHIHYKIMNRLHEKGLVDNGFMLEFFDSHTAVCAQPSHDHPFYSKIGINVYSLFTSIYQDIDRISMNPTKEDKEYFPEWAGNGDWLSTTKWAMENFRDESFIQQFLSPKIVRDFKLFSIYDHPDAKNYLITDIHNKRGFLGIRNNLSKMFDLMELIPDIQVNKVDIKTRKLYIKHSSPFKKNLDEKQTLEVLEYMKYIWQFDVVLQSIDDSGDVYCILSTEK